MEFSKNVKSLQFPMVQGSLNPNIIFLHETLWPVAWKKKKKYKCYIRKKTKNANKKRKNENFEKQKNVFFYMSQGSLDPKIRFIGQKLWLVAWNKKFTSVI